MAERQQDDFETLDMDLDSDLLAEVTNQSEVTHTVCVFILFTKQFFRRKERTRHLIQIPMIRPVCWNWKTRKTHFWKKLKKLEK